MKNRKIFVQYTKMDEEIVTEIEYLGQLLKFRKRREIEIQKRVRREWIKFLEFKSREQKQNCG